MMEVVAGGGGWRKINVEEGEKGRESKEERTRRANGRGRERRTKGREREIERKVTETVMVNRR